MAAHVIGTCSVCGGPVVRQDYSYFPDAVNIPSPICLTCGRYPVLPNGPIIEMIPKHQQPLWEDLNGFRRDKY